MIYEESNLQMICVRWFRLQYPALCYSLFAVPNGWGRSGQTGRILKAEGVLPGVADLQLQIPAGAYHGLCIELKTAQGKQSPVQLKYQNTVECNGYKYIICRSLDDFMNNINQYLSL